MKNLLIYVNPRKDFDEEHKILAQIQIDNSLDLRWKKEDILLVTNFDYEYRGIRALVVNDDNYCVHSPKSTKTNTIANLFKSGLIEEGKLYWTHDFDVYQLETIIESELELGAADIGLTNYGRMPRLNLGSIFFKKSSEDIFGLIKDVMYKFKTNEENALMILTTNNTFWASVPSKLIKSCVPADIPGIGNINERVKKINITYDFIVYNLRSCYQIAKKPLRAAHFHIFPQEVNPNNPKPEPIDFFIRGNNKLGIKLVPERLIKIFNGYGIK